MEMRPNGYYFYIHTRFQHACKAVPHLQNGSVYFVCWRKLELLLVLIVNELLDLLLRLRETENAAHVTNFKLVRA